MAEIGHSFICPVCLKELYQCLLFRKKCQSADEYFKTKIAKIESQLWDENEFSSEFVNIKLEALSYESNDLIDLQTYEHQTEVDFEYRLQEADNFELDYETKQIKPAALLRAKKPNKNSKQKKK